MRERAPKLTWWSQHQPRRWFADAGPVRLRVDDGVVCHWQVDDGRSAREGSEASPTAAMLDAEACAAAWLREGVEALGGRVAALEVELAQLKQLADRVYTVADEATGPHPVMPADEALTLLERAFHEQRIELAQLKQPAHVLAEAERLLRSASVRDLCLHLDEVWARASVWYAGSSPDVICPTLAEAYAKLAGGRDG